MSYVSPGDSEKDFVRSLIGDIDSLNEAFKDVDIEDHLAAERLQGEGKVWLTAATLLDALGARYAVLTKGVKSQQGLEVRWTFGTPAGMSAMAMRYRRYGNVINSPRGIVFLLGQNSTRRATV